MWKYSISTSNCQSEVCREEFAMQALSNCILLDIGLEGEISVEVSPQMHI